MTIDFHPTRADILVSQRKELNVRYYGYYRRRPFTETEMKIGAVFWTLLALVFGLVVYAMPTPTPIPTKPVPQITLPLPDNDIRLDVRRGRTPEAQKHYDAWLCREGIVECDRKPVEPVKVEPPQTGNTITGAARVVDGDTVDVAGVRVRLKGVDAAEMNTELGRNARRVMIGIVGGSGLTCELTGEKTYRREVGYCTTDAGVDIGQAIVAAGAALACARYSTRYVAFEVASAVAAQKRAKYCIRR